MKPPPTNPRPPGGSTQTTRLNRPFSPLFPGTPLDKKHGSYPTPGCSAPLPTTTPGFIKTEGIEPSRGLRDHDENRNGRRVY